ncbi:aldehyde ferredoxin oxidoreductase [Candidatus Bathyarchaeota archaeon]|nr:MAG: aldehyde ferredoxin oxidoreductase [Candidatus Bathyarchaeota archaeon]
MAGGYAGKLLEIDLNSQSVKEVKLEDSVLRQYIGGRGLAAKILWDRLGSRWEEINPLGPENILLMLTGPLTGYAPGARLCVSGKSPQSNGIVGSTMAGEFPVELRCAGYDGIVFTGKSDKPVYVSIFDSQVEFKDASHIWGKDAKETLKVLVKEGRDSLSKSKGGRGLWREPAAVYIGPAGENLVRVSAVVGKWAHAAGYGGYGAVMGSKNLKAVIVKGTGPLPEAVDMEKAWEIISEMSKISLKYTSLRHWGTGYLGYDVGARLSSEPVKNWQEEWHDEENYSAYNFERFWAKRFWGDFGCPLTCLKLAVLRSGPFKGAITDNPDYENQAYLGTNLGIFDAEANIYLTALIDDLGLCGIQCGNLLGFTAELYQRGILSKKDLGGIDLKWGNVNAFADLVKMIVERKGIGDILAEGTYRAALKISEMKGVDALRYAVVSKGIGIGAHGLRSGLDYPRHETYVCSVQGGDHTSPAYLPLDDPLSEFSVTLFDSGVFCWFNFFTKESKDLIWGLFEAVTGWKLTPEEWYGTLARRIIHIQRVLLLLGGPDISWNPKVHDDLPPRWYEPLRAGPHAGKAVDKKTLLEAKKKYYEAVGWDENGIPKSEELKRLGMDDLDRKAEILRRRVS